jgi:hypothetical protein
MSCQRFFACEKRAEEQAAARCSSESVQDRASLDSLAVIEG